MKEKILVERLHAALRKAPKPRGKIPRILLMLTGGLDSVALLANLLDQTNHHIHAHHIELHNVEERGQAEADAILNILPYIWQHYRKFEYSSSKSVFHIGWGGFDITLAMFFAARVHISLGGPFDYVITGHRQPETGLKQFTEATAVYQACFVNETFKPAWLIPLTGVDKAATFHSIPKQLAKLSWSCRRPVKNGDAYSQCGECHACKAIAQI